ncbi:unnamed protein product [Amoebophrya sp. A120]|nr:unnamed protein product [Amoebophrya sp. A120]|eukprot:GSA120T00025477001.1
MSGFRHKNLNSSTAVRLLLTTGVLVYGFLALLGVDGRLQPKLSAEGATQIELSTLGGKKLDLPSDMPCSDAAIKLYDMLGSQFRVGGKIVGGDQQMDIDSWLDDKNKNPFMVLHDERLLGEKIAELNPPAGAAINVIARHLDENERDLYFVSTANAWSTRRVQDAFPYCIGSCMLVHRAFLPGAPRADREVEEPAHEARRVTRHRQTTRTRARCLFR